MYNQDIEIVKQAIKTKLWRTETGQKAKWIKLLKDLSVLHEIQRPKLSIGEVTTPQYNPYRNRVSLDKYSVISLLHEFAHAIHLTEEGCKKYSEKVFKLAYKPAQRLVRDERGYLIKPSG